MSATRDGEVTETLRQSGRRTPFGSTRALVIAMSVLAGAVCGLAPSSVPALRVVFALPLVFVLPGYALLEAVYPPRTLGWVGRLIVIVALSLACSVLGGLALNLTGPGLTRVVWAAFLATTAVVGEVIAWVRWRDFAEDDARTRR
jgi:uncharacterized membrane protein